MAKKLKSLNPIIGTGYKTLSMIKDGEDGSIENFPDTLPIIPRLSYKRLGVSGLEIGWEFEDKIYYTYELYGSTTKGFEASEENLIFQGLASSYFYEAKPGEKWYFKARAKNTHGRYTEFSSELVTYTVKLDNLGDYVEGGSINGALIENATINNAHIKDLHADKITAGDIDANRISASVINAINANISNATIDSAKIGNLSANKITAGVLDADRIGANSITANKIEANAITSEKIQANAITTDKLAANIISSNHIQSGTITSGHIQSGTIESGHIKAGAIESDHIKSNSINSNHIQANTIQSEHIQANTIQSEHIQTGAITAGSGIIAEGAIGSAQISSLDAAKIEAGTIDTSKVTIQGANGHLRLKGNRMQVFQGTGNQAKERVSVGDVNGDGSVYGLRVRGTDGQTILLDENGVKSEGITDGAITNDKISDDANIDGAKLNINSVVSKINEDGTETIQGTKIEVDGTTLNTKLSSITTKQTEDSERITQAQSQITANTNAIKLKVDEQTYTTDKKDMSSKLEKNTSEISTMKGQIALKVEQTDIENAKSELEGAMDSKINSAKAEIKVTTDAISQNVSNLSQTVSTKADGSTVSSLNSKVSSLETGVNGISGKVTSLEKTTTTLGTQVDTANTNASSALNKANSATTTANNAQNTANTNKSNITNLQGEVSTVKSNVASLEVTTSGISQKVSSVESTTATLSGKVDTANNNATNALNKANSANTLADSKAKVFTTTPTVPYKVGDLWVQGASGDVMKCKTARSSGSYTASDWEKASKYTDDTKANAVDGKITNLQAEYNKTKSQVAEIVTDLDGITQRVSSTESTTATLTNKVNTAQNTADSVNNKIDNLKVGGDNLLFGTTTQDTSKGNYRENVTDTNQTFKGCKVFKSSNAWADIGFNFVTQITNYGLAKVGDTFTYSIYAKTDDTVTRSIHFYGSYGSSGYFSAKVGDLTNKWTQYSYTFTVTEAMLNTSASPLTQVRFECSTTCTSGKYVYWACPQLETGNKVSDYSPASREMQSQIDTHTTQINTTNSKVSSIETNLNSITSRVSSAETNIEKISNASSQNLLYNSDFRIINGSLPDGWSVSDSSKITLDRNGTLLDGIPTFWFNVTGLTENAYKAVYSPFIEAKAGEKFVASAYVIGYNKWSTLDNEARLEIEYYNDSSRISVEGTSVNKSNLNWQRLVVKGTAPTGTTRVRIRVHPIKNGQFNMSKPMLQYGETVTGWDRGFDIKNLTTRLKTAESKITDDAITNTVKKNFYTKSETDSQITSKGYQTESQVQQTVNGLEVKVKQSGGYNLLKNGDAKGGLKYWSSNGGGIALHSSTVGQCFKSTFPSGISYSGGTEYSNWVKLKPNTEYVYSAYIKSEARFNGSTITPLHMHCTTDRTATQAGLTILDYDQSLSANIWKRIYVHFRTINSEVWFRPFVYGGGSSSGNFYVKELGLYESKLPLAYSPHPSEVYDGITTIDKDGVTVTASNVKSKTTMSADGFKITKTDNNEDVFKVNSDGTLYMKGQITVTGGSVPTSNLSGTISSNQLNSSITSDINNAKNNASSALSTANTAKNTADTAKSTADSAKSTANTASTNATNALNTANSVNSTVNSNKNNWSNAYNRVKEWASGAVTGTTYINGGMIAANTITANKLAIMDLNNYAELNENTYSSYGFTRVTDSSASNNPWYQMSSLKRDTTISKTYTCKGGETFRVTANIYSTAKASSSSSDTSLVDYRETRIGIYSKNADGTMNYQHGAFAKNNTTNVSTTITLPSTARTFYIAIQINGHPPFSGTVRVRNVEVKQMSNGELIVDGAITANKIASRTITADKIAAGTITANEIKAGTITATQMAANSVTADKIAAGAITAKQMAIGDFNNYSQLAKGKNLVSRYGTANWTEGTNGHSYWQTTNAYFPFTVNETLNPFKAGDKIQIKFDAYTPSTRNVSVGVWFYSDTAASTHIGDVTANVSCSSSWGTKTVNLTLPTGNTYVQNAKSIAILINNGSSGERIEVRNATVNRLVAGDLIVNGTITTDHIHTNGLNANVIKAGTISADRLDANTIVSKVNGGTTEINGNRIQTGTLSASKITTGTLDASKVTVTNLNASNIKSGKLSANYIDATNLAVKGSLISGQINGVGGIKFADGAVIASYDSHVPGSKGISVSAPSIKLGDKVSIYSPTMYFDVVGKNNTTSATTTWTMSSAGALTCASATTSGQLKSSTLVTTSSATIGSTLNVKNNAINGMNNLAMLRGSVYIPIFGSSSTFDYIKGGRSTIAFADTGPIHFLYNGSKSSFVAGGTVYLPHAGNVNCDHFRLGAGIMACPSSGSFHFLTANGNTSPLYAGRLYSADALVLNEPMVMSNNSVFDKINSIDVIETKNGLNLHNPISTTNDIDESPDIVKTVYNEEKDEIKTTIDYTSAIATLWKAVQELKQENDELKEIIKDIHSKL